MHVHRLTLCDQHLPQIPVPTRHETYTLSLVLSLFLWSLVGRGHPGDELLIPAVESVKHGGEGIGSGHSVLGDPGQL